MFTKTFKKIKVLLKDDDDKNGRIKWSLYKRIWLEIGRPNWKWLAAGVLFTVGAAGAEGFTITLVKQVVDKAFIEKSVSTLYMIGIQIVAAFGAKGFLNYAKSLTMSKAGFKGSALLQNRIYEHVVKVDISKFYSGGTGKHLNYFSMQANAVLNLVTGTIIDVVQNVSTLLVTLVLMIWFAPKMCIVLLFLVPAITVPMVLITRKKRRINRAAFGIANTLTQHLNQTMHGIKTIQAFGNEKAESEKFSDVLNKTFENSYKNTQASAIQGPLLELMISIGLCFSLIIGGGFIISGSMSVGDFIGFILALTAAYKPAKNVTGTGNTIMQGLLAAEVLFDFLDSEPDIQDVPGATELARGPLSVDFSNISFSYKKGEPVLTDINLSVPAGTVCALVGPSGGGKTTLFNLLSRFYEPQDGEIKVNGTNINKYTLNSLRKNIADVSQDVFLFSGTIAENIKYGAPNATEKQVIDAAIAANAHDFISGLPAGYGSMVGERGALLSGGQKQRIAIARAILKDAPILLLDEATSALDTQSEKLIQEALNSLMVGRTTFVIAHRLSTILDADMICVIKEGKILERGTDEQLVAMNGEYKMLRDIQFKKKD